MRRLTLVVLAAFAPALFGDGLACASGKARVFADDHITFANGLSNVRLDNLKAKYGKAFLYVERGGKAFIVTDTDTLDRVRAVMLPQSQVGQQQAALGSKQAALGSKQAAIGIEQARVGVQQISASETEKVRLEARQRDLSRRQEALGARQEELGKQQAALGAQQEALQKDSDKKIDAILDQAIIQGLARQVQ